MKSMWKYICCDRSISQEPTGSNTTPMSFLPLPGQAAATKKPRAQVALAPKHGLMDWIRIANATPDLAGTGGKLLNVTEEELAKHDKISDCWTAIAGNVYNITAYLDYHPGGVDEIMKGAGIDATALFQDIHSWVNYSSMLEKCFVGRLVTKHKQKTVSWVKPKSLPNRLRFDFCQPDPKSLTLNIYTACMTLIKEQVFVQIENSKKIFILVFIDGFIHTVSIDLLELIRNDINVRISSSTRGQIQIDLKKQVEQTWKSIGKFLSNHLSVCLVQDFEPLYFNVTLIKRTKLTHDTDWYIFALPSNVFLIPPIGYHIRLKQTLDGVTIVKPYTVVDKLNHQQKSPSEHTVELLIKHYENGVLTPLLKKLEIGDTIEMSSYDGTFDTQRIDMCETLILIAAGSGFTPMIRIINYVIEQTNNGKSMDVYLLFFNKTQNDIICREELETISKKHKFTVHHILSTPDAQWTGETGYVRRELLQRLLPSSLPKTHDTQTLVCICGPSQFSNLAVSTLKELDYNDNHLHLFLA